MKNLFLHRAMQFVSLLLGVRIFRLVFLTFSLYVFTFFIIKTVDFTDVKIHGIIFCSLMSIAAGGLINQFYDEEKDKIIKPFRARLQAFLKKKYFLYFYLILNVFSLGISLYLSWRIFLYFIVYQFFIWFYSHKLSKILLINNFTYVLLSVYPFFGILVYYQYFTIGIFLLSAFLFLLLLSMDIIKDLLSREADEALGYQTFPIVYGVGKTSKLVQVLLLLAGFLALFILTNQDLGLHSYYFGATIIFLVFVLLLLRNQSKKNYFVVSILLKIWIFVGVISMLVSAVFV